jgi:hypothetical protein
MKILYGGLKILTTKILLLFQVIMVLGGMKLFAILIKIRCLLQMELGIMKKTVF